jgi:5-methylcytosine-specific restriction endonuclease McrA
MSTASRKERGLCSSCKNPPREGKTLCQSCADRRREKLRAKREEGYCIKTGCWNKVVSGASRCPKCTEKRSRYNKRVADAARDVGLCPACGGKREDEEYKACRGCRAANLARVHKGKYGGNREAILIRDNGECQLCHGQGLPVHHIDGSGGGDSENNAIENLVLLCKRCHADIHRLGNRDTRGIAAALIIHPGERADIANRHAYVKGEWRRIRSDILERDGNRCALCASDSDRLVVHHKDDRGPGRALPANNEANNLVTMCRSCHNAVTNIRNNSQRQLASKLIHALGPGTTGQQLASQPPASWLAS